MEARDLDLVGLHPHVHKLVNYFLEKLNSLLLLERWHGDKNVAGVQPSVVGGMQRDSDDKARPKFVCDVSWAALHLLFPNIS